MTSDIALAPTPLEIDRRTLFGLTAVGAATGLGITAVQLASHPVALRASIFLSGFAGALLLESVIPAAQWASGRVLDSVLERRGEPVDGTPAYEDETTGVGVYETSADTGAAVGATRVVSVTYGRRDARGQVVSFAFLPRAASAIERSVVKLAALHGEMKAANALLPYVDLGNGTVGGHTATTYAAYDGGVVEILYVDDPSQPYERIRGGTYGIDDAYPVDSSAREVLMEVAVSA